MSALLRADAAVRQQRVHAPTSAAAPSSAAGHGWGDCSPLLYADLGLRHDLEAPARVLAAIAPHLDDAALQIDEAEVGAAYEQQLTVPVFELVTAVLAPQYVESYLADGITTMIGKICATNEDDSHVEVFYPDLGERVRYQFHGMDGTGQHIDGTLSNFVKPLGQAHDDAADS